MAQDSFTLSLPMSGLAVQAICEDVLLEKYAKEGETTIADVYARVARGLASVEAPHLQADYTQAFFDNMMAGAIGAGRIMSAAGTEIQATLINCFVQPVGDCIQGMDDEGYPGIYEALLKPCDAAVVWVTTSHASGPKVPQ